MRIGIIARAKQGDIFEALEKRGWSQRQGAEFCGMGQGTFGRLINMRWVPEEFPPELTVKLYELTGKMPEELFPDWARERDFLSTPKVSKRIVEVTLPMLQSAETLYLPPTPEEIFSKRELEEKISQILPTLSLKEEQVVQRGVMNDETFEDISKDLHVSRERVRQICVVALRKLRHPSRARVLRDYLHEIS